MLWWRIHHGSRWFQYKCRSVVSVLLLCTARQNFSPSLPSASVGESSLPGPVGTLSSPTLPGTRLGIRPLPGLSSPFPWVLRDPGRLVPLFHAGSESRPCGLVSFASPSLPSTPEEGKGRLVLELIWDENGHFD